MSSTPLLASNSPAHPSWRQDMLGVREHPPAERNCDTSVHFRAGNVTGGQSGDQPTRDRIITELDGEVAWRPTRWQAPGTTRRSVAGEELRLVPLSGRLAGRRAKPE